jgi:solute carrier family 25 carnitine/acylcarnitine transporter 20/29
MSEDSSVMMNDTLMQVEHTPPVHKRILDILPGVSGGVARIMVGQPFDTIKTRMQVLGKGTIGAAGMPPDMVYNSGMDCVRKMVSALSIHKCLAGNVCFQYSAMMQYQSVRKHGLH